MPPILLTNDEIDHQLLVAELHPLPGGPYQEALRDFGRGVANQAAQRLRVAMWQGRRNGSTTHPDHAWHEVTPTATERTVEERVAYLRTLTRGDGQPAYEFRKLYVCAEASRQGHSEQTQARSASSIPGQREARVLALLAGDLVEAVRRLRNEPCLERAKALRSTGSFGQVVESWESLQDFLGSIEEPAGAAST